MGYFEAFAFNPGKNLTRVIRCEAALLHQERSECNGAILCYCPIERIDLRFSDWGFVWLVSPWRVCLVSSASLIALLETFRPDSKTWPKGPIHPLLH